jgi:type VI secretion system protein ImpJ
MSWRNRVIWSEGLFLRPQHFQQQVRYLEQFVEGRSRGLRPYSWGCEELEIDRDMLRIGKLSISMATGVFPDGTPFNIPDDEPPPQPIELDENVRDQAVYLGLPVRQHGTPEVVNGLGDEGLARYARREIEIADVASQDLATAPMHVGPLRTRLLLQSDQRDEYACVPICHILEQETDKNVLLKDEFIPTVLNCQAAPRLAGFLTELQGLLHARGESLAGRVSDSGRGGAAEFADFLLLQTVNRYEPLITHLATLDNLHPEDLYRLLVSMAGELATLTTTVRRPRDFAVYKHHDLRSSFEPVMTALRDAFSTVQKEAATPLPLKEKRFGIRVSKIADRNLLQEAVFVLAVHADMPMDDLMRNFPAVVKVGSVERIRELVNSQLPGIPLRALPVAPRQIPYHAGFAYFELERGSEYWNDLATSGGFAIQVGAEYPGLEMQFWAIRG